MPPSVEGAITMFVALIAIVMLPDFPHNTRFGFSKEELQVAQLRMLEDVSNKSGGTSSSAILTEVPVGRRSGCRLEGGQVVCRIRDGFKRESPTL